MRPIERIRAALGPAPRPPLDALERPPPPSWCDDADPLTLLWQRHDTLVRDGVVVWAHLFMANAVLFEPGDSDAPAGAVYSLDPIYDRHPEWLEPIGNRLFTFHEGEDMAYDDDMLAAVPLAPEVVNLRHSLRSGYERSFGQPIPPELAGGRRVYSTTVMIHRAHLPEGHLTTMRVPLLVERRHHDPAALVVPGRYWPASMT